MALLLPSTHEFFKSYGLTPEKLQLAKADAIVMHPGPINRGGWKSTRRGGWTPKASSLPQVTFGIAGAHGGDEHRHAGNEGLNVKILIQVGAARSGWVWMKKRLADQWCSYCYKRWHLIFSPIR